MTYVAKVSSANDLYVFTRSGQVVDCQTSHRTHVSGGGDHHGVRINSSTTEQLRLFLREADGGEVEVQFDSPGLGVRQGNRVSVVYAGHRQTRSGYPVGMVNHDTGRWMVSQAQIQRVPAYVNLLWGCLLVPVAMFAGAMAGIAVGLLLGTLSGVSGEALRSWSLAGFVLGPVLALVASLILLASIGSRNARRTRWVVDAVNAEIHRVHGSD